MADLGHAIFGLGGGSSGGVTIAALQRHGLPPLSMAQPRDGLLRCCYVRSG